MNISLFKKHNKFLIKLYFIIIQVIVYFVVLITLVIYTQAPFFKNLSENSIQRNFFLLAPQGFAYFTLSPHAEGYTLYKIEDNKFQEISISLANSDNLYGLSKINRLKYAVISSVDSKIPKEFRYSLKSNIDILNIYDSTLENVEFFSYKSKYDVICGRICIFKRKIIPWEWRGAFEEGELGGEYFFVNIDCNK